MGQFNIKYESCQHITFAFLPIFLPKSRAASYVLIPVSRFDHNDYEIETVQTTNEINYCCRNMSVAGISL